MAVVGHDAIAATARDLWARNPRATGPQKWELIVEAINHHAEKVWLASFATNNNNSSHRHPPELTKTGFPRIPAPRTGACG
jgi:hypothetical protein